MPMTVASNVTLVPDRGYSKRFLSEGAVVTFHVRVLTAVATRHTQHFADVMVFMDTALIHRQQVLIVMVETKWILKAVNNRTHKLLDMAEW